MSRSTISTFELFQMFPRADSARLYFEAKHWPLASQVCLFAMIVILHNFTSTL